LTSIISSLTRY